MVPFIVSILSSDQGCLTNRLFSQTPSDIFSSLHSFKCCFGAGRQAGRGGKKSSLAAFACSVVQDALFGPFVLTKMPLTVHPEPNRAIWTFFSFFFQPHSLHRKHAKVGGKRTNYHCAQLPTLPAMEEKSVCVLCVNLSTCVCVGRGGRLTANKSHCRTHLHWNTSTQIVKDCLSEK